jgi:hypothetical protein
MEPNQFDIGNKKYLTYQEYVSYALSNYRTPLSKNETGNRIPYHKVNFKSNFYDYKSIFDFLSRNGDFIEFNSLKRSLKKLDLNVSDQEIRQLIEFYSNNGKISYNTFKKSFDKKELD